MIPTEPQRKPYEAGSNQNELSCIGSTTSNEYKKFIEQDLILNKHCQQVLVKEPTINICVSILRSFRHNIETQFHFQILDSALITAVELSHQYIKDQFLPHKALIHQWTGVSVSLLPKLEEDRLYTLRQHVQKVIERNDAIDIVIATILKNRSKLLIFYLSRSN
ncbi:hypothetical protein I4U23_003384 [Adineta vaga]|nr:hypothetical protein I4U23_003384 [Adineta vaga]